MKCLRSVTVLVLLFTLCAARAGGPEEQYVELYGLLQEADKLNDSGQTRGAVTKYLEVQSGLKQLQSAFPDWNSKIITFRLGYVASRVEPLTQQVASGAAGPGPAIVSPGQALTNQLRQLHEEAGRLANQNALLEAKLREALTVQPAASDPRELNKAEDKIRQLQKERDLLAVTLDQSRPAASPAPSPAEDLKKQIVAQASAAELLRKQNEELQRQLSAAARTKPEAAPTTSPAEWMALREAVVMLQASNRVMQSEQAAMETRLLEWVRSHGSNATGTQPGLEAQLAAAQAAAAAAKKDHDELLQKLAEVTRQINQPSTGSVPAGDALEKQLDTLRAKLQIFEAKSVPYTPEELAFFKQPAPRETSADTSKPVIAAAAVPAVQKKRDELPAGAGGLMAAAERAIDSAKYVEAEAKLNEILRMDEGNVYLLSRLAAAQLDQDKTSEAESNLKKALAIDPEHPASLAMLGDLKFRQEKYDEAIDALSLASKFRPDRPDTYYMLGRALIQKGNRGPAETALRKAVQLKPTWGEPHYQLAVLYATQQPGFPELAQYHYNKAIAGGIPRNVEFEGFIKKQAAAKP